MDVNIEVLESIINGGNFDSLIGEYESEFLECKRSVYDLKINAAKYELAKDVSAFANAGGGYILIGIETKKSEKTFYDEIIAIHPLKEDICNPKQYIDIISDWIYPKLRDIVAKWYPTKQNPDKGIFAIHIPNQSEIDKPFLIKRTLKDDGKISETLFGFSERKQESNKPKTIVELHRLLRDGLNYGDNLDGRLQSIETSLQELSKPSPINDEFYDIEKRVNGVLASIEMEKKRALILTCYPDIPTKLQTLFSSKPGSLKSILESPPKIREHGFGLRHFDRAKIINGKFCRVTGATWKAIDLYRDGVLLAALEADEEFLCWAMKDLVFNPVALIESIYNFVQLYECVIKDMTEKPKKICFKIDLRNLHLNGKKNRLFEGDLYNRFGHLRDAPDNNCSAILEVELKDFELSKVAYNVTEEIYLFFGIEAEGIPYTKETNGIKSIDAEQIKSV
jgi:hypothetical protein